MRPDKGAQRDCVGWPGWRDILLAFTQPIFFLYNSNTTPHGLVCEMFYWCGCAYCTILLLRFFHIMSMAQFTCIQMCTPDAKEEVCGRVCTGLQWIRWLCILVQRVLYIRSLVWTLFFFKQMYAFVKLVLVQKHFKIIIAPVYGGCVCVCVLKLARIHGVQWKINIFLK